MITLGDAFATLSFLAIAASLAWWGLSWQYATEGGGLRMLRGAQVLAILAVALALLATTLR